MKLESVRQSNPREKLLAEFFGTFVMVLSGTGAIVMNDHTHGAIGIIGIGLAFGGSVFAMIYLLGSVSGAHINPAVTIGLWIARKIRLSLALGYVACQFAGAIAASLLLLFLFPHHPTLGATVPAGSASESFFLETLLTFVLLFAILTLTERSSMNRITTPLIVGSIIALEASLAGPISGASMNPARSLAPALISCHFNNLWIYLIAPTIGAILAIPVSAKMFVAVDARATLK